MDIKRGSATVTRPAPAEWFTGSVWQEEIIRAEAPARVRALRVRFDPGARTNWHTHPLGQTLYVVAGSGLVQTEGGPVQDIRAGDTVWIAPHEKHWHGAGPNSALTHIAIQEALDGTPVDWLEPVTDAQYAADRAS